VQTFKTWNFVAASSRSSSAQEMLLNYKPNLVFNTDQSGLELEMRSNRTLSFKGEKLTLAKVRVSEF
jgi:hypothetical protein